MACEEHDQQTAAHLPSKRFAVPWCHATEQPGAPCVHRTCGSWLVWKAARGMPLQPGGPPPARTRKENNSEEGDDEHEPRSTWSLFSEIRTDFVFSKTPPQCFLLIIIKGDVCVCSSVFLGKDKSTASVHLCVCMSVLQPEALPEALLGSSFVCLRIRHAITGPPKANGTSITSAPAWATAASTVTVVAIKQIHERKLPVGQKQFGEQLKASPSWDAWGNLRYLIEKISML